MDPAFPGTGRLRRLAVLFALAGADAGADTAPTPLPVSRLGEVRHVSVAPGPDGELRLETDGTAPYAWADVLPPDGGGGCDLGLRAAVEADVANPGSVPVRVMLWAVPDGGWDAVCGEARLEPGERRALVCPLRQAWPDGTPKLDPGRVRKVRLMLRREGKGPGQAEFRSVRAAGHAPGWVCPPGRLIVPDVSEEPPAPGRRVRFRLPGPEGTGSRAHFILGLPVDWEPGKRFPVIAEFPGNIFYVPGCYSTGLPDQCVIGHGMTRGAGAICLGLPFLEPSSGAVAEHGWGDADATARHAEAALVHVCERWGGDRERVVLTGFSRGAIACGFIGLRDDRIASWWRGMHLCQHFDGDGWNGATLEGALLRAGRFQGKSVFQTDNAPGSAGPVMEAMRTEVVWADSGLGGHGTAMFLDDRPSTMRLRSWFRDVAGKENR
jgi:hypothetical protein